VVTVIHEHLLPMPITVVASKSQSSEVSQSGKNMPEDDTVA